MMLFDRVFSDLFFKTMYHVIRPRIPYQGPVTGGCHVGKRIEIRGLIPYGADRFTVNLQTGLDSHSDLPFHISVRFDDGLTVVRNTRINNSYGREERSGPFPFAIGQTFKLEICIELTGYSVYVNNQHCFNYTHRVPFSKVCSIKIDGDVQIHQIDFINSNPTPASYPATVSASYPATVSPALVTPAAPSLYPSYSGFQEPPLPCIFPIYGGIRPGMTIFISAKPTTNPQKFTVNLQSGTSTYPPPDLAFHFDVRFFTYSVVRNSRVNNVWGPEENMISHFPFQPGTNFEMQINIQGDVYAILLNGQYFVSFRHRLNTFPRFNILSIENDVIVSSIRYN